MADARIYPGARDLLWRIHNEGIAVVVATSAPSEELGPLLELLDADDAIDAATTADDVLSSKPGPEVFLKAMAVGAIDPGRALALGDSVWDIQAARAAGIGCIAVESGGFSQHELAEAGAVRVYRDVHEVLDQFRTGPLWSLLS
jgi:HAD superfamily hydrolase (TIGR01509 family)